jgi:hypothetical protein
MCIAQNIISLRSNNLAKPFVCAVSLSPPKPAGLDPQIFCRHTPNWLRNFTENFTENFLIFFFLIFFSQILFGQIFP